jgi:hypothetical protein
LRKAGFDARYMAGGHFAWKAAKGTTRLFDSASSTGGAPESPAPTGAAGT